MFVSVDPQQPEPWLVAKVIDVLRRGGVAVLPTDTVYGIACAIDRPEAVTRVYAMKGLDPKRPLSILLRDVGDVAVWTRSLPTPVFRMMKRVLPGPYTFILAASAEVPRIMLRTRKTIGVRVPDNAICQAVLAGLDAPLLTTSVRTPEGTFVNAPLDLEEQLGGLVDVVVDGGPLAEEPSTIVDLTGRDPVLVRRGKGDVDALGLFDE